QELLPVSEWDESHIVSLAILLTAVAGAVQIGLAVTRLGGLVNLLSHPVVSGFTGAAAIIIGTSQLKHLVGYSPPAGESVVGTLLYLGEHISDIVVPQFFVGLLAIGLIVGLKKYAPKVPAALTAVVAGIAASWLLNLEGMGVAVLGDIPSGVPSPHIPTYSLEQIKAALPMGLAIGLIGFMESISAAKTFARMHRYDIDPSQELIALGAANLAASSVGGYTVGGALSRTAVNAAAGARTPMANVFTALAIAVTLLFLTPLFYYLPTPVLAAIILVAVAGLLDLQEWVHLWRVKRDDLVLLVITFCATLFGTIEAGIVVGIVASLLWLVFTSTRPDIATLGRVAGTRSYRCVDHFPDAETWRRVLVLRMDAQFFFGNVTYLKETLYQRLDETPDAVALVLDASSMNALDSTAADTFVDLVKELRDQQVEVFISHVKGAVLRVMDEVGLTELLGEGHLFYEVEDALQAALRHREAVEAGVPLEQEDFGPSDPVD
ncbi:MAG: STAS domain-containing protein, partial [Deltaproteobacteria bacterium]|nr:STAS domain-containing protein [Deltaproteobacteria bacterium]